VPLRDHTHDLDAMLAAVTDRTRLIFVCNPNNPTSTVVPPEQLARFVEAVPSDVLVVIDDADERVELAGRNVPNAKVLRAAGLNVYDLLRYHHLVVTKAALERIKERVAA